MSNTINNDQNVAKVTKQCSPLACEVASAILTSASDTEALDTYTMCGCDKLAQGSGGALASALFGAMAGGVNRKEPAIEFQTELNNALREEQDASKLREQGNIQDADKKLGQAGENYFGVADIIIRSRVRFNLDFNDPKVSASFESAVDGAKRCFGTLKHPKRVRETLSLSDAYYAEKGDFVRQANVWSLIAATYQEEKTYGAESTGKITALEKVVSVAKNIKDIGLRNSTQAVAWEGISVIQEKYNFHVDAADSLFESTELSVQNADFAAAIPKLDEMLAILKKLGMDSATQKESMYIRSLKDDLAELAAAVANPFPEGKDVIMNEDEIKALKEELDAKLADCVPSTPETEKESVRVGFANIEAAILAERLERQGVGQRDHVMALLTDAEINFSKIDSSHPLNQVTLIFKAEHLWNRRPAKSDSLWEQRNFYVIGRFASFENWKMVERSSQRLLDWLNGLETLGGQLPQKADEYRTNALKYLAKSKDKLGNKAGALASLLEVVRVDLKGGDVDKADAVAEQALKLADPKTADGKKAVKGIELLKLDIQRLRETQNSKMEEAKRLFKAGAYKRVLDAINEALGLFKRRGNEVKKGEAYMLLGAAQEMLGLKRSAIDSYGDARRLFSEGKDPARVAKANEAIMNSNLAMFMRGRNQEFITRAYTAFGYLAQAYRSAHTHSAIFPVAERLADAVAPFVTKNFEHIVQGLYKSVAQHYRSVNRSFEAAKVWQKAGQFMVARGYYREAAEVFENARKAFEHVSEIEKSVEMAKAKKAAEEAGVLKAGKAKRTNNIPLHLVHGVIRGGEEAMQALMRAVRERKPSATETEVLAALTSTTSAKARIQLGLGGLEWGLRTTLAKQFTARDVTSFSAKDRKEKTRK